MTTKNDERFIQIIEDCIKYHASQNYSDESTFKDEIKRQIGEKSLKEYLKFKQSSLDEFYKKS